MDDLATLLPTSKATWLLVGAGVTALVLRCPHLRAIDWDTRFISPFLAAGAWLSGALAVLVWLWR
jgi:hypothetical protein